MSCSDLPAEKLAVDDEHMLIIWNYLHRWVHTNSKHFGMRFFIFVFIIIGLMIHKSAAFSLQFSIVTKILIPKFFDVYSFLLL